MSDKEIQVRVIAKYYWRQPTQSMEEKIERRQEQLVLDKIAINISIAVEKIIESVLKYTK